MKKKIYSVHVGVSGFPFGRASINRCLAIYTTLVSQNIEVLAINKKAVHSSEIPFKISKFGIKDGVRYFYTTPSPYKPNNVILRRYYNIIGKIKEIYKIIQLKYQNKIDVMFFYPTGNFIDLLYYRLFSILLNIKLITHYVEYRSAFKLRNKNIFLRINDALFDKYLVKFTDGIIPISNYLVEHIKTRGFKKKYIKVPPLVNFDLFPEKSNIEENYFLYIGSLGFFDVIKLVIKAYDLVKNNDYKLYLIVHGSRSEMNELNNLIKHSSKKNKIRIFNNLKYSTLINISVNAKALLIPLRNNIQDIARFPNKISEYTATKNPIISTNIGEVKFYFKDKKNALLVSNNSPESFASKMDFIISNKKLSSDIGYNGYELGKKIFNNKEYQRRLREFVENVIE